MTENSVIRNREVDSTLPSSVADPEGDDAFFVPLDEPETLSSQQKKISDTSNDEGHDPENSKWLPNGMTTASFIVSLVVHINILVLLAAIWMMQTKEDQSIGLITTMAEQPGESDTMESLVVESLSQTEFDEETKENLDIQTQLSVTNSQLATSAKLSLKSSIGDGDRIAGLAVGKGSFFGARTAGDSFVFIVDNSGSMNGKRFLLAVQELNSAIEGLQKNQKFYVIFYNSIAVPMPHTRIRKLLSASKRNKSKATKWISKQKTTGGTMPQEAVIMGLKLKPQVIFFLTDGIMPREIRTTFQDYNKRSIKTIVHTIAFQSRAGELILKGIAEDHLGRYRFIK